MALISYFTCNEGSGNILHDTYGTNNLTRSAGDIGWGATAHGSNTYSFHPETGYPQEQAFGWGTTTGGPFSLCAWVNKTSNSMGPLIALNDSGGHFLRVNGDYIDQPGNQLVPSAGNWFHLGFVLNGTTYQYYVDGVVGDTGANGGWGAYTTIQLGAYNSGYIFPAYVNDIYFFNEALSQADVVKCMNNTYLTPPEPTYKKGILFKRA